MNELATAAKKRYEETPGWASAFERPDAEGNQPRFTGDGVLENGDRVQVSVWLNRAKSGVRYFRIHIEPARETTSDDGPVDADDLPF